MIASLPGLNTNAERTTHKTTTLNSMHGKGMRRKRPGFSTCSSNAIAETETTDLNMTSTATRCAGWKAQHGDIVTVDLELVPENGFIPQPLFDTSGQVSFVLGWGNYLPGLHDLVAGMGVGDSIQGKSVDAGWGAKNPDLIVKIEKQAGKDYSTVHVGMKLALGGGSVQAVVTKVTQDHFVVDANPPMAGSSYAATITLLEINDMPSSFEYRQAVVTENGLICRPSGSEGLTQRSHSLVMHGIPQLNNSCRLCSFSSLSTVSSLSDVDDFLDDANVNSPSMDSSCHGVRFCRALTGCQYQVASFALGCFWGGELAFMRVPGVVGTRVGYTQGHTSDPTYDEICKGTTAHVEAILIVYDSHVVSYEELIQVAMGRLDDTTNSSSSASAAERMNAVWGWERILVEPDDEGSAESSQYRHGVYYHNDAQRAVAERYRHKARELYGVEMKPALKFYEAEDFHQQYLLKGGQSAKKGATEPIRCYG